MKNELKIYEFKSENNTYLGDVYVGGVDKYRIPNSVCLGEVQIYRGVPNIEQNEE